MFVGASDVPPQIDPGTTVPIPADDPAPTHAFDPMPRSDANLVAIAPTPGAVVVFDEHRPIAQFVDDVTESSPEQPTKAVTTLVPQTLHDRTTIPASVTSILPISVGVKDSAESLAGAPSVAASNEYAPESPLAPGRDRAVPKPPIMMPAVGPASTNAVVDRAPNPPLVVTPPSRFALPFRPLPDTAISKGQPTTPALDRLAPLSPGPAGTVAQPAPASSVAVSSPSVVPPAEGSPETTGSSTATPSEASKPDTSKSTASDPARIAPTPVVTRDPAPTMTRAVMSGTARQVFAADLRRAPRDPRPVAGDTFLSPIEAARVDVSTATATAALDLRQDRWPSAMVERIERLRDAVDAVDTRIRLIPDTLGSIDVAVKRDGDTVHVHFTAEQAATRALLQDAAPRLAEAAEARGLKLGQTAVGDGDGDGDGDSQPGGRQPQPNTAPVPARPSSPAAMDEDAADTRIA
ncbi:flagellar hook-length control protein FliK [uncultured Sphingomonas sp.]|uniref:flagellar hook-length control protein FliK n=1 Tax=uncultured Sphingomonas sp. TaxID=158754 RepID=UPI0035C9E444